VIALLLLLACGPRPEGAPRPEEPGTERLVPLGSAIQADPSIVPQSRFQGAFAGFEPPDGAEVEIDGTSLILRWREPSVAADRGRAVQAQFEELGFTAAPADADSDGGYSAGLSKGGRVLALGAVSVEGVTVVTVTDLGDLSAP
jgi:hypothetical protein